MPNKRIVVKFNPRPYLLILYPLHIVQLLYSYIQSSKNPQPGFDPAPLFMYGIILSSITLIFLIFWNKYSVWVIRLRAIHGIVAAIILFLVLRNGFDIKSFLVFFWPTIVFILSLFV